MRWGRSEGIERLRRRRAVREPGGSWSAARWRAARFGSCNAKEMRPLSAEGRNRGPEKRGTEGNGPQRWSRSRVRCLVEPKDEDVTRPVSSLTLGTVDLLNPVFTDPAHPTSAPDRPQERSAARKAVSVT